MARNRHIHFHIIISPPLEVREAMLSHAKYEELAAILEKHSKAYALAYEHGESESEHTHIDIYVEFINPQAKADIKNKFKKLLKDIPFNKELYDLFICIKPIKTPNPRTMLGYTFKESPLIFKIFNISSEEIETNIQLYQKAKQIAESKKLFKVQRSVGSTLRLLALEMTNDAFVESTLGMGDNEVFEALLTNLMKRGYVFNLRASERELVRLAFQTQFSKEDKELWTQMSVRNFIVPPSHFKK